MVNHLKNLLFDPRQFFESLEDIEFEGWRPTRGKTQLLLIVWLIVGNFLLGLFLPRQTALVEPSGFLSASMFLWILVLPIFWLREGRVRWDNTPALLGLLGLIAHLGIVNTLYVQFLSLLSLDGLFWLILGPTLAYFLFLIIHYVLGVTEYKSQFTGWKGALFFLMLWIPGAIMLMPLEFNWQWAVLNSAGLLMGMVVLALYLKWRGTTFSRWRFGVTALVTGGALYFVAVMAVAFLVIFSYRIQPIERVEPMRFQQRIEKANAQENFQELLRLARRADELENVSDQTATDPDTTVIERHRETMAQFRELLEGKRIQIPRDLFYTASKYDEDTEWEGIIRLIKVAKLHRGLGERELMRGDVGSAIDRARFLVTAGDTLVQAEGTDIFRLTAYPVQYQGLNLLGEIIRENRLTPSQLERMKKLVKHYRTKRIPYHDLLVGRTKTNETYLSVSYIGSDYSDFEKAGAKALYSRSFRKYRMSIRKYYRKLATFAQKPYWRIKDRSIQGIAGLDSMEHTTPLHMLVDHPHGVIGGMLWELSVSMDTPKLIYRSEARAKTRMNCLLKTIHRQLNPNNSLPEKYRLNLTTGEPLPDNCLAQWESMFGCGCDGDDAE